MSDRNQPTALLMIAVGLLMLCLVVFALRPVPQADLIGSELITYRIDPNRADAQTLCLLPRIGPGIAQRIIDDRETHGAFQSPVDLTRVSMVGDKTVAALRPWVTLESQDTRHSDGEGR